MTFGPITVRRERALAATITSNKRYLMPNPQEPDVPTPADYSPISGAEAFAALMPQLADETPTPARGITLTEAAVRGMQLAKLLDSEAVKENVRTLTSAIFAHGPSVGAGLSQRLRDISHALYYRGLHKKGSPAAPTSNARVPVELWDEVQRLRRDLLDNLTFVFRGVAEVEAALALIRPGAGYFDHANDLALLAELAKTHSDMLARTLPTVFNANDAKRARHLATAMLEVLTNPSDAQRDDTDQRLWSLFTRHFRDAVACLAFIWRHSPELSAQLPNLGNTRRTPAPIKVTDSGEAPVVVEADA